MRFVKRLQEVNVRRLLQAFPGMVPYKRPAADKSGVPVYQPNATTYQQLMQLQQPFVPVSCEYSVSPAPVIPATSAASSPPVAADPQPVNAGLPQPPQLPKEADVSTTQAQTNVPIPALPSPQSIPDPAALAKEVAQQNYAKAVKLAQQAQQAASQSYANSLNPLNYTGVSLNKQAMTVPPPAMVRYPANYALNAAALGLGFANPYASLPQANLLNLPRPPPSAGLINPYSFMRSPYQSAASAGPQFLLGAQYHPVSVAATAPIASVPVTTQMSAAAAQNNNNNVVLQPYKKLKTT